MLLRDMSVVCDTKSRGLINGSRPSRVRLVNIKWVAMISSESILGFVICCVTLVGHPNPLHPGSDSTTFSHFGVGGPKCCTEE